ncbi:MAG: hypothetical protein HYX67_15435 [Candidatus Melainabacteria bacterium]|nr:hypothetical protein [Candidatus Melainabacteria bacterium]
MTTIIEQTDSGSSAVGMILGILLAVALIAGGLFYFGGGVSHTETNTTVLPAPSAPAPQVNITTPAPAAPAAPAEAQ